MSGSFNKPFATITSLCEPYSKFRKFILLVQPKKCFYELWPQHKQLKTTKMSEAGPHIYDEGYIHPFPPEPTHKSISSCRSTESKDTLSWNIRPHQ